MKKVLPVVMLLSLSGCLDSPKPKDNPSPPPNAIPHIDLVQVNYSLSEDSYIDIIPTISDPDGDATSLVVNTNPAHGSVICSDNSCRYIPNINYNGSDSFSIHSTDGKSSSNNITINLTVTPVNDPPILTIPDSFTYFPSQNYKIDLRSYMSDVENQMLTCSLNNNDSTVSINNCILNINESNQSIKNFRVIVSDGVDYSFKDISLNPKVFQRIEKSHFPIQVQIPAYIYDQYSAQIISSFQAWEESLCLTNKSACHGLMFSITRSSSNSNYYNLSGCAYLYRTICDNVNTVMGVSLGDTWVANDEPYALAKTSWAGTIDQNITYYFYNKIDIILNFNFPFSTTNESNKYDFQTLLTHEVGHILGLPHSSTVASIMYPTFYYGILKRTLSSEDINLVRFAYPEMINN